MVIFSKLCDHTKCMTINEHFSNDDHDLQIIKESH